MLNKYYIMKTFDITVDMLDNTGLDAISLVLNPAVEVDFLKFSKVQDIKLQFTDEDKHIITGIALLADTPIYRETPDGTPYNVKFSRGTIRQLVEKYFRNNLENSVNIEHDDNMFVDNVTLLESYIIDKERGIIPVEFQNVPDGSWVVSYKVNNPDVWDKIKAGELRGFSVQGLFGLIESKFTKQLKHKYHSMNKLKEALKSLLLKFDGVTTDKGELTWDGDKQLEVGDAVYIDGKPAADGEYTADDKVFVVKEGKVDEIRDVEVEVPEAPEVPEVEAPEVPVEAEAETPVEEVPVEAPVEEAPETPNPIDEIIAGLEKRIAELESRIAALENTPVVEPVVDEFDKVTSVKSTGNKTVDKYSRIFASR